ncbi:hypothetical protein kam1_1787 [Methylacidiphilum kamchatkense Kam1]|uniref:Uncharacterized protein n=1 Tax=Methylacidiphilum kamchatkense Kam1 TaxID=1202785 RepID=A0A516TP38_9BACT|nr:hypothetical protein kam1_1787 [Methylacidiphilum kamchatkense Kam1]
MLYYLCSFQSSVEEAVLMKPYYYYNVFFEIQTKLGFVFFALTHLIPRSPYSF